MDPISLSGAYESVKATKEILGALFNAKVDAEAKAKISEAQSRLGEVQDTLFSLRERLSELQGERDNLKSELAAAQAWAGQISQYELSTTPGGAVVYRFRLQPEHFVCPSCVNKR